MPYFSWSCFVCVFVFMLLGIQESSTPAWISWGKSCWTRRMGLLCGILVFGLSLSPSPAHPPALLAVGAHLLIIYTTIFRGKETGALWLCAQTCLHFPASLLKSLTRGYVAAADCRRQPPKLRPVRREVLFSPQSHFYVVHFESHRDLKVHISLSLRTPATVIAVQQTIPTNPQLVAYPTENVCFNVNVYM